MTRAPRLVLLLIVLFLLFGCGSAADIPTPTAMPGEAVAAASTPRPTSTGRIPSTRPTRSTDSTRPDPTSTTPPTRTATQRPAIATPEDTATALPDTPTAVPTATPAPSNTAVPPSATPVPPTATLLPPTATTPPLPTATPLPLPTDTPVPVPPTEVPVVPTEAPVVPTEVPVVPTEPPPPPVVPGEVVISFIYYDGQEPRSEGDEYVVITNNGGSAVNLAGWRLNADDNGQDFYFPSYDLAPGASCRVYTNRSDPATCGFSYGNGSAIWANDGECGHLFNAVGVEVSTYCY